MFEYDVDGSKRNNKRLLPRRNFAIIKEYMPGTTPPPSPTPEQNLPTTDSSQNVNDRAYPPDRCLEEHHSDVVLRDSSITTASDSQRPNTFQRRPTNLSLKEARRAAAKGGAEDDEGNLPGYINLEHGLDISLCMEVDQHDAAGHTVPYRLLVRHSGMKTG
ncbi:hypothetical protein MRB53_041432 [Persea americana]|nr:hypothetical protein MRB53_041432 [Persea americana]